MERLIYMATHVQDAAEAQGIRVVLRAAVDEIETGEDGRPVAVRYDAVDPG